MYYGFSDPAFWAAVAFVAFIALLLYYKVQDKITTALDERASNIETMLDEARKLREDAQATLAEYQRRQRDAEQEAEEIKDQAKREAEAFAAETRKALKEIIERRMRSGEEKIARAQAQALADIRTLAANVAVNAAGDLITQTLDEKGADRLISQTIDDLKTKLN